MSDLLLFYLIIGLLFALYTLFASDEAQAIVESGFLGSILWFTLYVILWFPIFIVALIVVIRRGNNEESEK
jgi:uncharacterized MnhB-related membrane protein